MATKNPKMGSDPLAWITQDESGEIVPSGELKTGRPKLSDRIIEKSSQENLPEGWTRATFILREDRLKRLKDYAYTDRRSIKDVVNQMIDVFLEDKEIINR